MAKIGKRSRAAREAFAGKQNLTVEDALARVARLKEIVVGEVACLIEKSSCAGPVPAFAARSTSASGRSPSSTVAAGMP